MNSGDLDNYLIDQRAGLTHEREFEQEPCKHEWVTPPCMSGDGPYCLLCGVSLYEGE